MAASDRSVDQAADELYGLPPGEFTSARDELVKRLRKDDREAANAVKALRKPTVAAWALNQLARERRKDLDELLAAGDRLQSAQEKLLAGGDRAAFQRAAATERELVAKLAAEVISLTRGSGERPGAGLEEKVAATLHAAALDEETADRLRTGRLVREREAIGGFGDSEPAPEPGSRGTSGRTRSTGQARSGGADAGSSPKARGRVRPAAGARDSRVRGGRTTKGAPRGRSSAADTAARERLAGARTDERHARRELDAARKAVAHAQERADAAAAHAAEAAERAKKTAERLREAKQAETAAKKAHTKASKTLESAETAATER